MSAVITGTIGLGVTIMTCFAVLGGVMDTRSDQALAAAGSAAARLNMAYSDVRAVSASETGFALYSEVDVTLTNAGKLSYATFDDWDVVVTYVGVGGTTVKRYVPYSAVAADNTWRVQQLYLDSAGPTVESFQPGVLNPLEEVLVRLRLAPVVLNGTTGEVTVTPPAGQPAYAQFSG